MKITLAVFKCDPFQDSKEGLGWSRGYSSIKAK